MTLVGFPGTGAAIDGRILWTRHGGTVDNQLLFWKLKAAGF